MIKSPIVGTLSKQRMGGIRMGASNAFEYRQRRTALAVVVLSGMHVIAARGTQNMPRTTGSFVRATGVVVFVLSHPCLGDAWVPGLCFLRVFVCPSVCSC